jgi:SHS2 domain-containing protein
VTPTGRGGPPDQTDFVPFEEAEHTADLAVIARGRDLRELVLNVCRGTLRLIGNAEGLSPEQWVSLEASAQEPERLLVRFVKELLLAWELHGGLPVAVEIEPAPEGSGALRGRLGLACPDDIEDRIAGLPKAATYHDLRIRRGDGILEVTLVLDV